ncbi:MAG: 1-deoxy-D-xylulose-5-phosphate synthase [Candidatus Magnetoovum sp. WYHC-5]|nr:1-deoxy-D-xylulose-5-phosphate synthase [Candidatus Magnetoovum sp. WYHC-5]
MDSKKVASFKPIAKKKVAESNKTYFSRLTQINSPKDIKLLNLEELEELALELRDVIIKQVSTSGGHLASSLGVIEMTLALHTVFDSPNDKIVWDVGHQSYAHKIITGRGNKFHTLRQHGGLSGFPKRSESPHDAFGTGHSSTSISAALGIVEGRDRLGKSFKVIAVIGDGAMTGGLAFEGLNHAGHLKKDLIVILNDNEMSISPNVGALSSYLTRMLSSDFYQKIKKETKFFIEIIPKVGAPMSKFAQKTEDTLKYFFVPGMVFEELGFTYVGPIDGHDIGKLIDTFKHVKHNNTPTLIHVITKKGKGYEFSEKDPCIFHGVGPFELDTGESKKSPLNPQYCTLFGEIALELANEDKRVVAITAAMSEGTGLTEFAKRHPERFYDVGIAEPHAATFAAGLASQGLRPIVAVYSTFLQRAYDQVIHDICLQNLPVTFAVDRAGIVGEDGPTHHGLFDISYLRHIPNLVLMAPKNGRELKEMVRLAVNIDKPCAIRFPRGTVCNELEILGQAPVEFNKAEVVKEGSTAAILAVGHSVFTCYNAAKRLEKHGVSVMVVNMRFIKPLDEDFLISLFNKVKLILTVEENVQMGGFGSSILEFINSKGIRDVIVKTIGLPDNFVEHGKQDLLRHLYGLDEDGIYQAAISFIEKRSVL